MHNKIDTRSFPKKLNLFMNLVYKQIGAVLQSVKYAAIHSSAE